MAYTLQHPARIYIAGFFDTRERLYPVRDQLQARGFTVTAHWLDEAPDAMYASSTEEYLKDCATRDIRDIYGSTDFLLDTIDATPRGGREVELGIALAMRKAGATMSIVVVGPFRNVFHRLADAHYSTWEEFFAQA